MNQNINYNNNSVFNPNNAVTTSNNNNNIILYAFMALVVVACFLPYFTASAYGYSETTNYVMYNGGLKDGIYVIALMISSFFACQKKSYKGAIICIAIAIGIFAFDYIDTTGNIDELSYGGLIETSWGIGFYLVGVGLIGSLVMSIIANKKAPISPTIPMNNGMVNVQPMPQTNFVNNQMPNAVQPTPVFQNNVTQPTTCQYCGNPRNEGLFCKSCGGRY